jgi:hypothetical protein
MAFMITRTGVHDRPEWPFTINWIGCSRSNGIGVHDPPERAGGGVWTRGLLIRRNISDGERAYFSTWCPAGTSLETLVAVEGQRWSVEDGFETAKTDSVSTITSPVPGMVGTAMSRW